MSISHDKRWTSYPSGVKLLPQTLLYRFVYSFVFMLLLAWVLYLKYWKHCEEEPPFDRSTSPWIAIRHGLRSPITGRGARLIRWSVRWMVGGVPLNAIFHTASGSCNIQSFPTCLATDQSTVLGSVAMKVSVSQIRLVGGPTWLTHNFLSFICFFGNIKNLLHVFCSNWKLSLHEKFGMDDGHLLDLQEQFGRIDEVISIWCNFSIHRRTFPALRKSHHNNLMQFFRSRITEFPIE